MSLKHSNITSKIIKAALKVYNTLGRGFLEKIYSKAFQMELEVEELSVDQEKPYRILYRDRIIGKYIADLVVDDKVIVELKAVNSLCREHYSQVINYLKISGIEVGLIFNFGSTSLEFKRLIHPDHIHQNNKY